jgi:hypothetical protein
MIQAGCSGQGDFIMRNGNKSFLAFMATCAVVLTSAASSAPANSPEAFLRQLYAPYIPHGKPIAFSYPDAAAIVDAPLLALLRRDQEKAGGEVGALDYDPVCQCQDWNRIKIVSIRTTGANDKNASLDVTFDDGFDAERRRETVHYELVRVAGAWKIHDIGSHDAASLRALLLNAKY